MSETFNSLAMRRSISPGSIGRVEPFCHSDALIGAERRSLDGVGPAARAPGTCQQTTRSARTARRLRPFLIPLRIATLLLLVSVAVRVHHPAAYVDHDERAMKIVRDIRRATSLEITRSNPGEGQKYR